MAYNLKLDPTFNFAYHWPSYNSLPSVSLPYTRNIGFGEPIIGDILSATMNNGTDGVPLVDVNRVRAVLKITNESGTGFSNVGGPGRYFMLIYNLINSQYFQYGTVTVDPENPNVLMAECLVEFFQVYSGVLNTIYASFDLGVVVQNSTVRIELLEFAAYHKDEVLPPIGGGGDDDDPPSPDPDIDPPPYIPPDEPPYIPPAPPPPLYVEEPTVPAPRPYYDEDTAWEWPARHIGYIYSMGDEINGSKPFQHLVTFDAPGDRVLEAALFDRGLIVKSSAGWETRLYTLPMPGISAIDEYAKAKKQRYRWLSKKFSFPGLTTLAAAKINRGGCGDLVFRLYEGCREVYACYVCDCKPFRLPANIIGVDFQIGLEGTATVHDVHVASSMQELTEEQ